MLEYGPELELLGSGQFRLIGPTTLEMTSSNKNWWLPIIAVSLFCGAFNASASLLQVLPEFGDLERWGAFSIGAGFLGDSSSESANIQGDVGVAGHGRIGLTDDSAIVGDVYYHSQGTVTVSGNATITGTQFNNQDAVLDKGASEAFSASKAAFATRRTRFFNEINLPRFRSKTITGAPGENVVLKLNNFRMSGNAVLTLQGTATTTFIINVQRQFSLSGNAKIVLSGGVTWDHVLFNITGTGAVSLSANSSLQGILLASRRTVRLSGNSVVNGEVIANKFSLSGGSTIIHPPISSP